MLDVAADAGGCGVDAGDIVVGVAAGGVVGVGTVAAFHIHLLQQELSR